MDIQISNAGIRLADENDRPTVVKILSETFKNDPHIIWLLEKSKRKRKFEVIINYVVDEIYSRGIIFLTDDNQGAALWQTEKKERFSFQFIKRNLSFLFNVGLPSVIRNLSSLSVSHKHFPANQEYYYLYMIGVLPNGQGKGLASRLLNPVLENCKQNNIPVFLETANPKNVDLYKKKGFVLTDSFKTNSTLIHFMKA
jgi:GNAT superfamily N-acetyltransferase